MVCGPEATVGTRNLSRSGPHSNRAGPRVRTRRDKRYKRYRRSMRQFLLKHRPAKAIGGQSRSCGPLMPLSRILVGGSVEWFE